jgi:mono/diheme cytochrome c family protein
MMNARASVGGFWGLLSCSVACSLSLSACGSSNNPSLPISGGEPAFGQVPTSGLLSGQALHAGHTAPVVGGTLLVTSDGQTVVAADPERDSVFLVNSSTHAVKKVTLSAGDEPGRVAEGPSGTVFVALRRGGALVAVDIATGTVARRAPVCASPRGVAYDANSASVHVACRSGVLLTLDANDFSVKRSLQLDTDLRDVIVRAHDLVVTRFLSSEVVVVGDDGAISNRATPAPEPGCGEATVAYRALSIPSGKIALAHQVSSDDVVQEQPGGYGFSCGGSLVARFLSIVDVDTPQPVGVAQMSASSFAPGIATNAPPSSMAFQSVTLPAAGPLDIAFDARGSRFAVIALDESMSAGGSKSSAPQDFQHPDATLWVQPWDGASALNLSDGSLAGTKVNGQPVAVAFDAQSKYIVQSREPATLEFEGGASVSLSSESHADTGHQLFHMDSGIGISCSSCHPEGGEDGHVWHFPEGLRRTLPLEGGVMERAPFHWDGTLGDMTALVNEVMVKRMSMRAQPSSAQVAALGSFLEQLPELPPAEGLDPAAVTRGEALFRRADVGCATCHSGAQYTNNQLADVGTGGKFVTPSLLGVGLRNALFHDGCAKSVSERFEACGGTAHGNPNLLSSDDKADVIAFLRSL